MTLVDMKCNPEQMKRCPMNWDRTCQGSCSLREDVAAELPWYNTNQEVSNMPGEWEKQEGTGVWVPQAEEETLEGEVVNFIEEGGYGPQWEIKVADGDIKRTPSHKVLQNRMIKTKKGDQVRIVYKGEEPPKVKGQNPTKMYEVFIRREGA